MSIIQYQGNLINSLLTLALRPSLCAEPVRGESSYGAGDVIFCQRRAVTFCDNENCQQLLCGDCVRECKGCGEDYCEGCAAGHDCAVEKLR